MASQTRPVASSAVWLSSCSAVKAAASAPPLQKKTLKKCSKKMQKKNAGRKNSCSAVKEAASAPPLYTVYILYIYISSKRAAYILYICSTESALQQ